jgi:hypothetical protein
MSQEKFKPENKEVLDAILLEMPGVKPGQMFGYPAYFVNGKLFACLYEEGVAIKIPENKAQELVGREGIIYFQPQGRRKMREWIQINREDPEEYRDDGEIFLNSIRYVASLAGEKK